MINIRHALNHMRTGHWTEARHLLENDQSLLGSWLHGILCIQDGDLDKAEYWYGRASRNFIRHGSVAEELKRFESELLD
jgi:hypothetical protein